ncbi:MAG TPA: hypothetical protein VHY80_04095 [Stellaceae bacterium]|nr:hypothetical protein [Stellaceae bacterium]
MLLACCFAPVAQAAPPHPLDPLSAQELIVLRDVLAASGQFSSDANFSWVALDEPPKALVEHFKPGDDFPRRAYVAAIDYARKKNYAVIVDLRKKAIVSISDIGTAQPGINGRDTEIAREIVDGDARVKAALVKRGLKIPGRVSDAVSLLYESVGNDPALADNHGRLLRILFVSDQDAVNAFAPAVDGVMAVVDLFAHRVVQFADQPGTATVSAPHDIFDPKLVAPPVQEDAPTAPPPKSIKRDGNTVAWGNWRFRFGFNLREGLVLYQVGFLDHGKLRPILYRASVSEVLTPYGDPSPGWSWMEYLDEGGFGLGYLSTGVRAGEEVPGNTLLISPTLPDPTQPRFSETYNRRVYLYERDAGNVMYYEQSNRSFERRGAELVIGFLAPLGNYTYGFNWIFREDGSFAFDVALAGEVFTKFVGASMCDSCRDILQGPGPDGAPRDYVSRGDDSNGTLVAPHVVAMNHQHWFNLRLDFDIDGEANAVMENNLVQGDGKDGPAKDGMPMNRDRAFAAKHTVFGRARDAMRDMNDMTARSWTIYNPAALGPTGRPAGYTLMPMGNAMTVLPPSRAPEAVGFTFHHFWVTPYRDGQLYADGQYPNQSGAQDADTLYHYADSSSIYDQDLVVWYSLGVTHFPRPEDYPIMSNMLTGIEFRPDGFFGHNPALDATAPR